MLRRSLWIEIERTPEAYNLKEYDQCFEEIHGNKNRDEAPVLLFVGAGEKSDILRDILGSRKQAVFDRTSGQVYLWQDLRHQAIYIDLELKGYLNRKPKEFLNVKGPRNSRVLRCTHGIPNLFTSRNFINLLCARGITPLANVACYFVTDLGGIDATVALLADQARHPPSQVCGTKPRILLVVNTDSVPLGTKNIQRWLLQQIAKAMKNRDETTTEEQTLEAVELHFQSIDIVSIRQSDDIRTRSDTVLEKLLLLNGQARNQRVKQGNNFNTSHVQVFSRLLLEHFCSDLHLPFSFIGRSRPQGFSSDLFPSCFQDLLEIIPSEAWISHLAVPLTASVLLLSHYPEQSHKFPAFEILQRLYADTCGTIFANQLVQYASKDHYVTKIGDYLSDCVDQLIASPVSAKDIHLQNLHILEPYLSEVFSNKSCLCCLHRAPEKLFSCGHAICNVCIRTFGCRSAEERNTFRIAHCILCGKANANKSISLVPPTAGPRVLSLDGGGIRGIISLVILNHLQGEMSRFHCAIIEYFDFVCGTSSGGLIAIGLFLMKWSSSESLSRFRDLARSTFAPRNGFVLPKLHELLETCWRDGHYSASPIEESFRGQSRRDKMFNPLGDDTKVAVVTTNIEGFYPCLLTNYNGPKRPNDIGYTLLRAKDARDDVSIGDSACSTSAAPWFFKPRTIGRLGTFQDGGLQYDNPLVLALQEVSSIWIDRPTPDVVLSLGTGTLPPCSVPYLSPWSPVRDRFLSRILRAFLKNLDGEKSWREVYNSLPEGRKPRFHRVNLALLDEDPSIDDIGSMQDLEALTTAHLSVEPNITNIRDSMLASIFYFELDALPLYRRGKHQCSGQIFCRLRLGHAGRQALYHDLYSSKAYFLVLGRPVRCVDTLPGSSPFFKKTVKFCVQDIADLIGISTIGFTTQARSISGFPMTLEDLVRLQSLQAPFGRTDHVAEEKPLPCVPTKRKHCASFF